MDRTLLWTCFLLFTLPNLARPQETAARSEETPCIARWDRAVCLHTEAKKTDGQPAYSTAFLVKRDDATFLVTAAHAAQETHAGTRVLFRNAAGASKWILLGALTDKAADPWRGYRTSDLSIMKVLTGQAGTEEAEELKALAIDFDSLLPDAPGRTTAIEIVGFPIALGTSPSVSPLAMKGYLASRELQAEAKWGTEPMLYAVPTVGAGCSGGPVFQSTGETGDTKTVGMFVGMMYDATGVKLSKIVPSRIIRAAVERGVETQSGDQAKSE
jgi:hypothetical protein